MRPIEGVRHHRVRDLGPVVAVGLRRTRPEVAAIRAAQWAISPRQRATLIAMTIQQRLTPEKLLGRWEGVRHSRWRALLDAVIADVCDGAHSLGELDFARMCRERGLPEPSRQALRTGPRGRVYLDVWFDAHGVHVEIQGAHHFQGTAGIDDALRFNAFALAAPDAVSLQIPVLGLRLRPEEFLDQVAAILASRGGRAA